MYIYTRNTRNTRMNLTEHLAQCIATRMASYASDGSYCIADNLTYNQMSLCMRKTAIWVPLRSYINRAVQSQKMVRGWKFWIRRVDELYYPCSENKGADLRLCFRLYRLFVYPCGGSNDLLLRYQNVNLIKCHLQPSYLSIKHSIHQFPDLSIRT